jgi:hypothetical protein
LIGKNLLHPSDHWLVWLFDNFLRYHFRCEPEMNRGLSLTELSAFNEFEKVAKAIANSSLAYYVPGQLTISVGSPTVQSERMEAEEFGGLLRR